MDTQDLGELKTVSNTMRDSHLEADDLIVGWVMVDGNMTKVAFTDNELRRPIGRAKENQEDLRDLNAKLFRKIDWLIGRSWWERLQNKMPQNNQV